MKQSQLKNKIYLIGFMGVGKSSVGRTLAQKLELPFFDTDRMIEKGMGKRISEIFAQEGEPVFRAWEDKVLTGVAGFAEPALIALGGGTLMSPENRKKVSATGIRIHLKASLEVLEQRFAGQKGARPLIEAGAGENAVQNLWKKRKKHYEEAEIEYVTDGKTVDQVVEDLLVLMGRAERAEPAPSAGVAI